MTRPHTALDWRTRTRRSLRKSEQPFSPDEGLDLRPQILPRLYLGPVLGKRLAGILFVGWEKVPARQISRVNNFTRWSAVSVSSLRIKGRPNSSPVLML